MSIVIYRHQHSDANELNEAFKKEFNDADIIFYENTNSENQELQRQAFQNLSDGIIPPEALEDDGSIDYREFERDKILLETLYNTKKKVYLEKTDIKSFMDSYINAAQNSFFNGDLKKCCRNFKKGLEQINVVTRKRDTLIKQQLKEIHKENKGKNILVLFGALHPFYYDLKREGLDIRQTFPYEKPYLFSFCDEVIRKIGYRKPFNKEHLAKAFIDSLIIGFFQYRLEYNDQEATKKSREILKKLNYEDIDEFSEYISLPENKSESRFDVTAFWLQKKGFDIGI